MILVIDNFDSFTYNLVQYLGELGADMKVYRNNELSIDDIKKLNPERIVISPGPCTPKEAGISVEVIKTFYKTTPILGVCLGHQSIGAAFGANVIRAPYLMHGKTSPIKHNGEGLFKEIENPFIATRYHSLILEKNSIPECLEITSWTEDDIVMGVKHKEYPLFGLQFHPESIMTKSGIKLLKNFLEC